MSSSPIFTLVLALLACGVTAADCPCGYTVNSTRSPTYALFTEAFETDFLHVKNLSRLDLWQAQAYQQNPKAANGPFGRTFLIENVVANPLAGAYDWAGNGIRGGDPGLQLWVNRTLIRLPGGSSAVPCAELVAPRDDLLYGSFRIGMKMTPVNGTCTAFFFYRDDMSEIDLEFLSRQQGADNASVNLVIQSPQNGALGYTAPGSVNFNHHALAVAPSSAYIEYRFDWLPGRVDFYADGVLLDTMTDNIPDAPGRLHISHWSNGNAGWSGGPPDADAVMTVSYVKAYFNSSDANRTAAALRACAAAGAEATACAIPVPSAAPNPSGPDGNETGHTPFLTNSTTGKSSSGACRFSAPRFSLWDRPAMETWSLALLGSVVGSLVLWM